MWRCRASLFPSAASIARRQRKLNWRQGTVLAPGQQFLEVGGLHRTGEEEALDLVDLEPGHQVEHFLGLDAFGDDAEAMVAGEADAADERGLGVGLAHCEAGEGRV